MISLASLTPKDIGRAVVYRGNRFREREEGTISAWNDRFIFVRYGNDPTSQATDPRDLEWLNTSARVGT